METVSDRQDTVLVSGTESQFSSSVAKLLHHATDLQHPLYPITLQLVPTDRCNLNCDFCSVKLRGDNSLGLAEITHVLDSESFMGLEGVEITGGGDPTLYPQINELIDLCRERGLEVGMITNGIALKKRLSLDALAQLRWIRVSLNALDYVPGMDLDGLPFQTTLGFSYVLNDRTTDDTIRRVKWFADRYHADYVRIVPDCLDLSKRYDFDLAHPKFYIQTKVAGSLTPVAPCRMGFLKPYLNSDGYFYWCSGVCLEKRYFPKEYRMGRWDEVDDIWLEQKPFDCEFSKCFWVEHNKLLATANMEIVHGAFI